MFEPITVEEGQTASGWVDLTVPYRAANEDKEAWSLSLGQVVWPQDFDQAGITLEFADDDTGTNAGALYAQDGATVESAITKPAAGLRTTLSPSKFSMVTAVRVVLPGAASEDFTFRIGLRKAS